MKGANEIDHLDAGLEDFGRGVLFRKGGRSAVNGPRVLGLAGTEVVHGVSHDVEYAPKNLVADRHGYGCSGVGDVHAANEPLGGRHGDRANATAPKVLLRLEGKVDVLFRSGRSEINLEGIVDSGNATFLEFGVGLRRR